MRGERGLLSDLSLLTAGQAAAQLLNLAALVFLARHLGDHHFGLVQLGVALSSYAMITAEWGLFSLGVRDVARLDDRVRVLTYARTQQGLLAVLALVVLGLGLLVLPLFPFTREDPVLFRLYLLLVVPQVFMLEWVGTGLQRMSWVGGVKVAASGLYAAGILLVLPFLGEGAIDSTVRWVPVIYLVSFGIGGMTIAPAVARWLSGWVRPDLSTIAAWPQRLADAAPLGGAIVLMRILLNSDVVMLGVLSRPGTAGVYAAAAKIGFLVVIAMEVLLKAMLPRLSRLAGNGPAAGTPEFRQRFQQALACVVAVLLPAVVVGVAAGPDLIDLVYGAAYRQAGGVFRILAVSYLLLAVGWFLGNSLVAAGRQRAYFPALAVAAVVTLTGHWVLIPRLDGLGAAWSMLLGHGVFLISLTALCRRWISAGLLGVLALLGAGAAGMAGVTRLAWAAGPLIAVTVGAVVYVVLVIRPLRRRLRRLG